ncbi:MAG TPA: flagellar protein FlaG [Candidatus Kapabacteria bacterium]|jgi:flagellar protein FlaG|nr:flagellar protein FlaG [Candidatus Kapabacteria bacterium]HOQ49984.1 flagellar protein FlaG [Candidatus Kapabacteria bacterium]HPP39817.1 flagellar protein FlaG [Candidatus Kapabacteria bacterium]HPU23879.1 flagellar protein FlaG [Candidatus Kapabacteria bacterium]
MINGIQPTAAIRETSLEDLQLETKKERFALLAEQFRAEFSSDKEEGSSVGAKLDKETQTEEIKPKEKEFKNKVNSDLKELGEKLKNIVKEADVFLEFSIDKDTNKMILRVIDNKTKEVIQQLPSEIALKIARIVSNIEGEGQIANAKV